MFLQIKKKIDTELKRFVQTVDLAYSVRAISPLLSKNIKDFVLRGGKRIRPILFIVGYRGFSKRNAKGLTTSAIAIELFHDFMLIHDDIIDKSETRRNKPSVHAAFNAYLRDHANIKFNGQDLAIIVGDILYAMAIDAFLAIKEDFARKEKALRNFVAAAMATGSGEFLELITGITPIERISKDDIYRIYDYKTARYTFACPLSTGAILAGAPATEIKKLFDYGIFIGRAFQIKDDILGMFGDERKIGKSTLSDLQEAKKTVLIWHAYNHSVPADKKTIQNILTKTTVTKSDLESIRSIVIASGSLNYARTEIRSLQNKVKQLINSSKMRPRYRKLLADYSQKILATE